MVVRIGQVVLPETFEEFLIERESLSKAEDWKTVVTKIDDILSYHAFQNDQIIKLLRDLISASPVRPAFSAELEKVGLPTYNVRKFPLGSARDETEINIPGDAMSWWTDGTLIGCTVRFDSKTEDEIPLDKFNPISFPNGWKKFYLTTSAQAGKTLWMFIGRAAGAQTPTQVNTEITTAAGRETFYTIRSDKDSHFTGALGQYAKEDENLLGMITNKCRITGVTLESDQQLKYKVLFWTKDTFDDTDLDLDVLIGDVDIDLTVYGWQVNGTGTWYMDVRDVVIDYLDEDASNELHVSLMNMSGTGKTAGASGEVIIQVTYSPRT